MATEINTASAGPAAIVPAAAAPASGLVVVYWLVVGVPLAWGLYQTVLKAAALFK